METLISLLIVVIVLGLIFWLIGMLPIAQPLRNIGFAIASVIAIVYLLGYL